MNARFATAALVVLSACRVVLPPLGADVAIQCTRPEQCPKPLSCQLTLSRCVATLDTQAPALVSVQATAADTLVVSFTEPIATDADLLRTTIVVSPALSLVAAGWDAARQSLNLQTDAQAPGTTYTVAVAGFADLAQNAGVDSSATFVGFGVAPDQGAPVALAPAPHALVSLLDGAVKLSWLPRAGASSYAVDVATDAELTALVGTFTSTTTETTVPGLSEGTTYYWRVRSNVSTASPSTQDFDTITDGFYVRCAMSNSVCLSDGTRAASETGSRARPLRDLNHALLLAASFALAHPTAQPRVLVARRDGGLAYSEIVVVEGGPVSLLGGYAADFATRDDVNARTRIEHDFKVMHVANVTRSTLIDGFSLVMDASEQQGIGFEIAGSGDALEVANIDFRIKAAANGIASPNWGIFVHANTTPPLLHAIDVTADDDAAFFNQLFVVAGPLLLQNAHLTAGIGNDTTGVYIPPLTVANVTIEDSQINLGAQSASAGIAVDQSGASGQLTVRRTTVALGPADNGQALFVGASWDVTIERSILQGPSVATALGRAIDLDTVNGVPWHVTVSSSVLVGGSGPTDTQAVFVRNTGAGALTIADSTLAAGPSGAVLDVPDTSTATFDMTNDIFAGQSGTCVRSPITSFQGNALFGCAVALHTAGTDYATAADVNALDAMPAGARYAGNVSPATTAALVFATPAFTLRPTAPVPLLSSGVDAKNAVCGLHATPTPCGGTGVDRDGNPRTAPFSMGAFVAP